MADSGRHFIRDLSRRNHLLVCLALHHSIALVELVLLLLLLKLHLLLQKCFFYQSVNLRDTVLSSLAFRINAH
jgi:hypothetical protein